MRNRSFPVYVPAVPSMLHPDVVPAILRGASTVQVVNVSSDDYAYARWFITRWNASKEPFMIVEHDVVVPPCIFDQLHNCDQVWCCAPYNGKALLGCTYLNPRFIGECPVRFVALPKWNELDGAIFDTLDKRGFYPHVHSRPRPTHHHGWQHAAV